MRHDRDGIIRLIGAVKLLKGLLLTAIGLGALRLIHHDVAHEVHRWIRELHIADDNHHIRLAVVRLGELGPRQLLEVELGSFLYAGLFLIEGIGLLLRRVWAEYVTIVITTSFIPLEIYELWQQESPIKALIIVLNFAIVIYLMWRLRRDRHWPFRR